MKNIKKNALISFAVLIILNIFYYLSVANVRPGDLADISLNIRDVKNINNLTVGLKAQNYLLKVKFFKNKGDDILKGNVFFNGLILVTTSQKEKDDYLKEYLSIPKNYFNAENNILSIQFSDNLPKEILVNISNVKKRISKDAIVLSRDSSLTSRGLPPFFGISLLVSVVLWFTFLFIYSTILKTSNPCKTNLNTFLAFLAINVIILIPRLAGYKIVFTHFIYWLLFAFTVGCSFLFILIKTLVLRAAKMIEGKKGFLKGFFFTLFLIFFPFFATLGVCEIFARVYMYKNYPVKIFKISDKEISYVLNPNAELDFAEAKVKINKDGYRGRLFPVERRDKKIPRIVFFGDSMMFGFGLNDTETLPEQLAGLINNNQGKYIEAINLSVTGHNLNQERLYFEGKVLNYNPDIAIFGLCLNDIGGSIFTPTNFNTLIEIAKLKYRYSDFTFLDKIQYSLLRISNLYQYIFYKIEALYRIEKRVPLYTENSIKLLKGDLSEELKYGLEMFREDLVSIKNTCDKQGIKLIILFYVTDWQLSDPTMRWPQKWLNNFCQENNIYFLDLLPAFEGQSLDEILIDQGHPSSYGNKLLASRLYRFLMDNSLI